MTVFSVTERKSATQARFVPCIWIYFKGLAVSFHTGTVLFSPKKKKRLTQNVAIVPINTKSVQTTYIILQPTSAFDNALPIPTVTVT